MATKCSDQDSIARVCRYCFDWKEYNDPSLTGKERPSLTYTEWAAGILRSRCIRCEILVRAIQKLEPEFLDLDSSDAAEMSIIVCDKGRFILDTEPRIGVIDFQIFSTEGQLSNGVKGNRPL